MIGIAHSNENEIFISDGSDTIFILDSDFAIESSLRVKFENGTYIEGIGDMVWLDGLLYAVSVSKRLIFVIDLYEGLMYVANQ
jgi:glutamine cyclotransferase